MANRMPVDIRGLVNWFVSPSFLEYQIPEFDTRRIANLICSLAEAKENPTIPNGATPTQVNITGINISEYCENDYLKPIRSLYSDLKDNNQYINHFLIHGSLATMDFVEGWSDLDTWVVIDDSVFNDVDQLILLQETFRELNKYLFEIDPIAHHGYITLLASNLASYKNAIMPLEVLAESKSLLGDDTIHLNLVNSQVEEKSRIMGALKTFRVFQETGVFRHHPYKGEYLSDDLLTNGEGMYQLKYLIGMVLSVPSLYYSVIGTPCYKRDSFSLFHTEFEDASILNVFSEIRTKWGEQQSTPYTPNAIPNWLLSILPFNYKERVVKLIETVYARI